MSLDKDFVRGVERKVLKTAKENGVLIDEQIGAYKIDGGGNPILEYPLAFKTIQGILTFRKETYKHSTPKIVQIID